MKYRYELIQYFIDFFNYKSYLEIGYRRGDTFKKIKCKEKISVDPAPNPDNNKHEATYRMSSDEFFEQCDNKKLFDIIFIDGAHGKDFVKKDILNSLKYLEKGGTIVCHDVCPLEKRLLEPNSCSSAWEAFAEIRAEKPDLFVCSVAVNHCGFIQRIKDFTNISSAHKEYKTMNPSVRKNMLHIENNIDCKWDFLNSNREELLNFIDMKTFFSLFKNKNFEE